MVLVIEDYFTYFYPSITALILSFVGPIYATLRVFVPPSGVSYDIRVCEGICVYCK